MNSVKAVCVESILSQNTYIQETFTTLICLTVRTFLKSTQIFRWDDILSVYATNKLDTLPHELKYTIYQSYVITLANHQLLFL